MANTRADIHDAAADAETAVSRATRAARATADDIMNQAERVAERTYRRARKGAVDAADAAADMATDTGSIVRERVRADPLTATLIAGAVGFVLGVLFRRI
jgi:ElaB/YqjD/DUF883 family membrane-anchored ribosome-binding protein